MTLRELILSVDAEAYSDSKLFQELLMVKPEYGSIRRIEVKIADGNIAVFNVHVGSLGDIVAYPIDVAPELQVSKVPFGPKRRLLQQELLDAILKEMSHV